MGIREWISAASTEYYDSYATDLRLGKHYDQWRSKLANETNKDSFVKIYLKIIHMFEMDVAKTP